MKLKNLLGICVSICAAMVLAACGSSSSSDGGDQTPIEDQTPAQKVQTLEKTGKLPKLDRTPTLAGPDTNGNGIRDDIDEYIKATFSNSKQVAAVNQLAKAFQNTILVDVTNKDAVRKVRTALTNASNCVHSTFPYDGSASTLNASTVVQRFEAMTPNTKVRMKAYLAYNKALDGSVTRLPSEDTCE